MKDWQIAVINKSLPNLIKTIEWNPLLVAYLHSSNDLSEADIDELQHGIKTNMNKVMRLLKILMGREKAFEHLMKALQECSQTGAVSILLEGIRAHALSKVVRFQGEEIALKDLWKPIDMEILQKIITDNLNATNYEQFLTEEPITVAVDTIPELLKYYIPRTVSINSQVDPKIFDELENDIFCVEGMEEHQLSSLSKKGYVTTGLSRDQIKEIGDVTARFIRLERHEDFEKIAEIAKNTVHWIEYNRNKNQFFYVKCSTGRRFKSVQDNLISKNPHKFSEDEFLEICLKTPRNAPILVYDSPGMGKSVLLASLASETKMRKPNCNVIYLQMSELTAKLRRRQPEISAKDIKQALVETTTEADSFGSCIMSTLLDPEKRQIDLFLDAFDEVNKSDLPAANRILDCIAKDCKNIRMFITTRPHRRNELEWKFGVLGYNILPFNDANKLSFFLQFWTSEHGVKTTDAIKEFANHCLKTLKFEISSEEGDIAGIPLQCRMLAEIYAEDAIGGGLIPTVSQLQLNSILQVYKHFIDKKFAKFCTDEEKQNCYDFHAREALRTLFTENSTHFLEELRIPDPGLIYKIGILEPSKSDPNSPGFSHRTLAEYFVSHFLATYPTSNFHMIAFQREFIHLFFQQALNWSVVERRFGRFGTEIRNETNFQNPVICRFLNFFLSSLHTERVNFGAVKNPLRESPFYNSKSLIGLLESALRIDAVHIYLFLLQVYLDLAEFSYGTTNFLRFEENLRDTGNWLVQEANKLKLVKDLKTEPNFKNLDVTAVSQFSLSSVKLSCTFLESVTGKHFFKFHYGEEESPMYCALQRGHYQIFDYLLSLDREVFYEEPLLHWCLDGSARNNVGDKEQIVKRILDKRPDLLNEPNEEFDCVPLLTNRIHFSLIKLLIEEGADITQTNVLKQNIAHLTAAYFSAEEYHWLVHFIISRKEQILLTERDKWGSTPVHIALQWIDLKSETLKLLAKDCKVNFNDNVPEFGSELAIAISWGRNERVIKDIIRLGGNMKKMYKNVVEL